MASCVASSRPVPCCGCRSCTGTVSTCAATTSARRARRTRMPKGCQWGSSRDRARRRSGPGTGGAGRTRRRRRPPSSDAPTHGMDGMITPSFDAVALEARASEEAEVHEEMLRLRSEMLGNKELEQPALQLALCIAARADDRPLATTALKLGANPAPRPLAKLRGGSVANEHGLPPLHMAVREGHAAMVQMLLDASAPPTLLSTAGMPPLILAAQSDRSLAALDLLLSAGASLAMRDDRRQTALHAAARTGAVAALQRLLVAAKEAEAAAEKSATHRTNKEPIIELRDRWHRTALHWAVVNQQAATIGLLVDAGANVDGVHVPRRKHNRATSLPLEAPLHTASRLPPDAALPLIRQLLEAKADPNRRDQFGQTPPRRRRLECSRAMRSRPRMLRRDWRGSAAYSSRRDDRGSRSSAQRWCRQVVQGYERGGRRIRHCRAEQHGDGAPSQVAARVCIKFLRPQVPQSHLPSSPGHNRHSRGGGCTSALISYRLARGSNKDESRRDRTVRRLRQSSRRKLHICALGRARAPGTSL